MKDVFELLSGHLDRTNTEEEEAALQQLLTSDPETRELLAELKTNDRLLKDEEIPVPADLTKRILSAIPSRRRGFQWKRILPVAGAAAAVLALTVVGISTLSVPRTEDIAQGATENITDTVANYEYIPEDTICDTTVESCEGGGPSYGITPLKPGVSHQKATLTTELLGQTETETEAFLIVWTKDAISLTEQAERIETISDKVTRYILPGECFADATALRCSSLLYSPAAGIPSRFSLIVVSAHTPLASRRLLVFSSRPGLTIPVPPDTVLVPPDHAILPVEPPPAAEVQAARPEAAFAHFVRLLQAADRYDSADALMDAVVGLYGTPKAIYTLTEDQLPGLLSNGGENLQTALLMPDHIDYGEEFEVYVFETSTDPNTVTE